MTVREGLSVQDVAALFASREELCGPRAARSGNNSSCPARRSPTSLAAKAAAPAAAPHPVNALNTSHAHQTVRKSRILIVDDDEFLRRTLAGQLEREGFSVRAVGDGAAMFQSFARFEPDLVLLDVRLPDEDGFSLMRRLRDQRAIPVVMLSGRAETTDKVVGLELGADDYVTKPFEVRELVARIRARLRVQGVTGAGGRGRCSFEGWTLDLDSRALTSPTGEPAPLTSHEFNALAGFVSHPGRVLDRAQLMDLIVGRDWSPTDRSVDVLVAKLRRRLDDDPRQPHFIRTVHGAGYLFAAKVVRA
jgi:DNA-binding response OmpR family regulator